MFILKITNKITGQVQQSQFQTRIECDQHFDFYNAQEFWGKNEWTEIIPEQIIHHDEMPAEILHHDEVLETKDELGNILIPATAAYDEVITPAIPAYDEIISEHSVLHEAEYIKETIEVEDELADISPRQIRLALLSLGITESDIDTTISQLSDPEKQQAMIAWKYSTSFKRRIEIVESIGAALGLTKVQLDQLWVGASTL